MQMPSADVYQHVVSDIVKKQSPMHRLPAQLPAICQIGRGGWAGTPAQGNQCFSSFINGTLDHTSMTKKFKLICIMGTWAQLVIHYTYWHGYLWLIEDSTGPLNTLPGATWNGQLLLPASAWSCTWPTWFQFLLVSTALMFPPPMQHWLF